MRGDWMGLKDFIFGRRREAQALRSWWKTLSGYAPVFSSWGGQLYESELIRAAIDAKARHASKLEVTANGSALPKLRAQLRQGPNPWQTWSQFLYRVYTIREVKNTAFVVPILDEYGQVCGYTTMLPNAVELVASTDGEPFVRFRFASGETAAMELSRVCILTKMQYSDDFFGESNRALNPTLQMIHLQRQGIEHGIKNGATFRFLARMTNFVKPEDLKKERDRFNRENLRDGDGGILLMPNTYTDIQQLQSHAFTIDADQMKFITDSVLNYFGASVELLQNKLVGDAWSAFYEADTEPFAIQLTEGLTRITYTARQRAEGNCIFANSNRLQYATNKDKLNVSAQMADRGLMTVNEIRAIWNLAPFEGDYGDSIPKRGEYHDAMTEFMNGKNEQQEDDDDEPGNEGV